MYDKRVIDLLCKYPGSKVITTVYDEVDTEGRKRCLCGKKFIHPLDFHSFKSLGLSITDTTCTSCRGQMKDSVRIICLGCQEVVINCDPVVTRSGFKMKKNVVYHVRRCPKCDKDFFSYVAKVNDLIPEVSDGEAERLASSIRIMTIEEEMFIKQQHTKK